MPLVGGGYARIAHVGDGREPDESVARGGYLTRSGRAPIPVRPLERGAASRCGLGIIKAGVGGRMRCPGLSGECP